MSLEEPTGAMTKVRKITPHIPPWKSEGTHSVIMIVEVFTDRLGNRAFVCTAHYKDRKNKDRECTAWVKWENNL